MERERQAEVCFNGGWGGIVVVCRCGGRCCWIVRGDESSWNRPVGDVDGDEMFGGGGDVIVGWVGCVEI